jgi:hypothetical protein
MNATIPTFLVTGAARSGTTGLVEGLRTNTHIFVTEPKEPHYFAFHGTEVDFQGPGDAATINRVALPNRADYLALFPQDGAVAAYGDGSVSTLYYHEHALPEVVRMNPDMRLVVMLREPVSRAYSSYQYMRARGFETETSFLAAVEAEPERQALNYHHLWHYTSMSMYADALADMVEAVGPNQVGVWYYDDLQSDYVGTVSQVMRFIGAPATANEAEAVPRVNISGTPRSAIVGRVIWAATRNEWLRRAVKSLSSYRTRERVRGLVLRRSDVPFDARRQLEHRFHDDLRRLNDVLDLLPDRPRPGWLTTAAESRRG